MTTSNANPPHNTDTDDSRGTDADELDVLFDVLANARRRRVVEVLREEGTRSLHVDALAARLAEFESPADTGSLAVSLHHVHLPKLDAAGVVAYDAEGSTARYVRSPLVERLLDLL